MIGHFKKWVPVLLLLTDLGGLPASAVEVEVNTRNTVAYLSPLIYGVDLRSSTAPWLVPAASSHGARLVRVRVEAESLNGSPPDLSSLIQVLRKIRMSGMMALLSFGDGGSPEATQSFVVDVLKGLSGVADNLTGVVLPSSLSAWIFSHLREDDQPSPLLPFRNLVAGTFYLSLADEQIHSGDPASKDGRDDKWLDKLNLLAGKSPVRIGLAFSGVSELLQQATDSRDDSGNARTDHRATPVSRFCPIEFSPFALNSTAQVRDNNVLLLASTLTDVLQHGVTLAAATVPTDQHQAAAENPENLAAEHLHWLTLIGLYDLLSDWGSLYGYQVESSIDPPLQGYASKSPGCVSLCLINRAPEERFAHVRWILTPGIYSVETRTLLGREGCPRLPRDEGLLAAFTSRGVESTVRIPAASVTVIRCRNEAYLANRNLSRLLDIAGDGVLNAIPGAKRTLIRRLLKETDQSVEAMVNGDERSGNLRVAASTIHRSLLRMAQVEAMLKNYALQGMLSSMNYNRIVGPLEDTVERLSSISARLLHVRLQMSCSDRIVEPGHWFRVDIKVANLGATALRNLRFFIEPRDDILSKLASATDHRSLPPGATTTCSFMCQMKQPTQPKILESVSFGITYYAYHSYARLRREVEVAIAP